MPLVNIMVNNRAYTIACDEGEEDHLKDLAALVDGKCREVLAAVGQVGDVRMMLMAALLMADEHNEVQAKLGASTQAATAQARSGSQEREALHLRAEQAEGAAADALEAAAKKLEDIAARLAHA